MGYHAKKGYKYRKMGRNANLKGMNDTEISDEYQ